MLTQNRKTNSATIWPRFPYIQVFMFVALRVLNFICTFFMFFFSFALITFLNHSRKNDRKKWIFAIRSTYQVDYNFWFLCFFFSCGDYRHFISVCVSVASTHAVDLRLFLACLMTILHCFLFYEQQQHQPRHSEQNTSASERVHCPGWLLLLPLWFLIAPRIRIWVKLV